MFLSHVLKRARGWMERSEFGVRAALLCHQKGEAPAETGGDKHNMEYDYLRQDDLD